jgi:hypothetical protein
MDEKSNLCQLYLGRLFAIRGDAGVTVGPSWSKKCSSFTLLQVFQVQMFSNVGVEVQSKPELQSFEKLDF